MNVNVHSAWRWIVFAFSSGLNYRKVTRPALWFSGWSGTAQFSLNGLSGAVCSLSLAFSLALALAVGCWLDSPSPSRNNVPNMEDGTCTWDIAHASPAGVGRSRMRGRRGAHSEFPRLSGRGCCVSEFIILYSCTIRLACDVCLEDSLPSQPATSIKLLLIKHMQNVLDMQGHTYSYIQ